MSTSSKHIAVALDGPSGAGKSSLAKMIAARLGYIYVDTGALYRSIGLYAKRHGVMLGEKEKVLPLLPDIEVGLRYVDGAQRVFLGDEDVSSEIRTPDISMYASFVSAIPEVRAKLLDLQRNAAKENNVIMDGRDIGTVILPDAEVKIFLYASDECRAKRRYLELKQKGIETTVEEVLADMQKRDKDDSSRDIAPAVPAKDAVMLDNSLLDEQQTLEAALAVISAKTGEKF